MNSDLVEYGPGTHWVELYKGYIAFLVVQRIQHKNESPFYQVTSIHNVSTNISFGRGGIVKYINTPLDQNTEYDLGTTTGAVPGSAIPADEDVKVKPPYPVTGSSAATDLSVGSTGNPAQSAVQSN